MHYPKLNSHNLDMSGYRSNTMLTKDFFSKNGFLLYKSPIFLAILFSRYCTCSFHDKLPSNKARKNFIVLILSISWLFIFDVGRREGILYFLPDLWNNKNLVFPTFSDCLVAENQSLTLINVKVNLRFIPFHYVTVILYVTVLFVLYILTTYCCTFWF